MNSYGIEVAPVSADIRIGSVVELEDGNSYEICGIEEETGYNGRLFWTLRPADRKASQRVCYRQIVVTYGQSMQVCKVRIAGYGNPQVWLKEIK